MHTGYNETWQLIGTSRAGYVDAGLAACEFSGHHSADGNSFIEDTAPFHCRCMVRDAPWSQPREVEQWGRVGEETLIDKFWDPWTGSTGTIYDKANTPFAQGRENLLHICKDKKGVDRWCWQKEETELQKPILDDKRHCAAFGTRRGTTMGYVAIQVGEIVSLLSFRRDGFALPWLMVNKWYPVMLCLNLLTLCFFVYFPPMAWLLRLVPLPANRLAVGLCFGILIASLDEVGKTVYRRILASEIIGLKAIAEKAARGQVNPWERELTK